LIADEETFEESSIKYMYQKFILKLWQDMTVTYFDPHQLRTAFSSSTFYIGSGQQDAPEFLDFFLLKLHDSINENIKSSSDSHTVVNIDNFVSALFMGQLKSTLTCAKCGYVSDSSEPFWSLSLPLPSHDEHKSVTIYDCLNEYTQEEKLQGDDKTFCSGCSSK
jgi:ubiquitin C-terminal hydrolase